MAALVTPGARDHPFLTPLREADVAVHPIEVRLRSVLAERRAVRELCTSLRPDVVHTHGYRPDIMDGGVARRLGIPTVSTEHGMSKMGGRTRVYEWLQLRSLRRYQAVAAVSEPIAETLRREGVARERIRVIPNAWAAHVDYLDRASARAELGLPADGLVLGFLGRLITAKGGDLLLDALERLGERAPLAALIGDGSERAALERRARERRLNVRFLGEHDDGARFLPAFDGFALPSRTEGTPIVLFEAMAAGVPVIASRVGGVPDVLGDTAWLVAPEDPEALAAALGEWLEDPARAAARADAARARLAERYALAPWLDAYEALYRSLRESAAASRDAR